MKIRLGTAASTAASATALLASLAAGLPAMAQDMKPGLWELSNDVGSPDPQMQAAIGAVRKQLADMTPAQRQAMQQLLDKNGVQLDVGAGGALRTQMCVTPEMIARKEVPMQQGDCAYRMSPLGANRLKVNFSCTRPHASGEGEMTVDTPTRYHARMTVRNQDPPNQTVDMLVDGRWLATSCGNVRPIRIPDAK